MTLSHLDERGQARMVDVGDKPVTRREAVARGWVVMQPETLLRIQEGGLPKGDVLATARLAGIQAAKRTWELIPLAHPLPLDSVAVDVRPDEASNAVEITATVHVTARTGAEMEALTAVAVAALSVYDMIKGVDRSAHIESIRLLRKSGGVSGTWELDERELARRTY
ncbi:MAG: cyclic pyranopterin monophosphate synthase MoaC [Anaerolineae bacterium]|nr:cyclic pyranopterin monophosphate synthase MoaC [Anaerolineae bacterium]